jgi:hypothetical protein
MAEMLAWVFVAVLAAYLIGATREIRRRRVKSQE